MPQTGKKGNYRFCDLTFLGSCPEDVQMETKCFNNLLPKIFNEIANFPGNFLISWSEKNIQLENI